MKKILLPIIALITVFSTVKAQTDFCKDITRATTDEAVVYHSPKPGDQFQFVKVITDKGATTIFKIFLGISDPDNSVKDVSITFEDNSVINFTGANVQIDVAKEKDIVGNYVYTAALLLSADDMAKFKTKKISSYVLLDKKRVPSPFGNVKNKVIGYANCLDALNDGPKPVVNANEKKSIEGFWGIIFGASPAEVKTSVAAKGGKFSADDSKSDEFVFTDALFTQRTTTFIETRFINDKFYQAIVAFPETTDTQLIPSFNTIITELENVYGPATITKDFEQPYHDGDGYEVQAIKLGKATYIAKWKTNNGNTISIQINKAGNISLFYTDTTLQKAKDAKKSADY